MTTLLQPGYLIFLLPIVVSLLVFLVSGITGLDLDTDLDIDLGDTVDGTDFEPGDSAYDGDLDNTDVSLFSQALGLLGVGKLPLLLALSVFGMFFGVIGLLSQHLLSTSLSLAAWMATSISLVVALATAAILSNRFSRLMAKVAPQSEFYQFDPESLIGLSGKAHLPISDHSGEIRFYDQQGAFRQVEVRTPIGAPPINRNEIVYLMEYNKEGRFYRGLTESAFHKMLSE